MENTQNNEVVTSVKSVATLANGNPINTNRRGRPVGSTSINSSASIKRLEELGFDPIQHLVEQYKDIQQKIEEMQAGKMRYSAMALANMETLKKGIADTLMKYAYKAVPTASESTVETKTPLKITLSGIDK